MAKVLGAHHTSFPVSDLQRSRRFYEQVLGLVEKPRPDFSVPGVWYQAGACEVHLIQVPEGFDVGTPAPSLNPMCRHAAFAIRDYAEMLQHLRAHGLEILEAGPDAGQMWVRDPDGHIIEFIVARP